MTLRSAPAHLAEAPSAEAPADRALDEALDHIGELAQRLWAVRRLHAPGRGLRGHRCSACRQPVPCPTVRAASAA